MQSSYVLFSSHNRQFYLAVIIVTSLKMTGKGFL